MSKKIEVRAGNDQTCVLDGQCDIIFEVDTIKEAKERAKYYVSGDYEKYLGADAGEPMRYSQVTVDGEFHSDYFKKGYKGQEFDIETGEIIKS